MDFQLSEEQILLRDTTRDVLARSYDAGEAASRSIDTELGLEPRRVEAARRDRHPRARIRRGGRRHGAGPVEIHGGADRDRPPPGAGTGADAVAGPRRADRRGRHRRAARACLDEVAAGSGCWPSPTPSPGCAGRGRGRSTTGCAARATWIAQRTQEPGARRRLRGHPGGQRGAARRRDGTVPGRRRRRGVTRTRLPHLRRPARRADRLRPARRREPLGTASTRPRRSTAPSCACSPPCAPRRSARWRRRCG